MSAPSVSVVITAHNAAATIGACLASVDAQAVEPPGGYEIVLVDDRSTDGTAEAARAAAGDRLRVLRIDRPADNGLTTRQEALAQGFAAARGDVALTLDADGIVPTDWVARMAAPILEGRADAIAGPVAFRARSGMLGVWQTVDAAHYLLLNKFLNRLGFSSGVMFGNFAFRRSLFADVGGFERIGFTLTEDLAFAGALQDAGARFLYASDAAAEFDACPSWSVLIERAKRVSAAGVTAIAVVTGAWMVSLAVLLLAAILLSGAVWWLFAARAAIGAAFTCAAVMRVGRADLVPAALLYEPLAILIGLVVMARLRRSSHVEWGGKRYER